MPADEKNRPDNSSPHKIEEPENALSPLKLEDLPDNLRKAAEKAGWKKLMPVQAHTIPYVLARRDIMVQSRTGSGKTGAFILPILRELNPSDKGCQALILVPTRELARQVYEDALMLGKDSGIRAVAVYGGVGYGPQIDAFRKGAQIVIGTPGRILDHLLKGTLSLKKLKYLVFDEADRMLSMGFYPDMQKIRKYIPGHNYIGAMFSATFPPQIQRLAKEFLHKPGMLSLSRDHVHVTDMEHVYYVTPGMDKDRSLVRIIEIENPTASLIFCNTRQKVHYITVVLQRFGYDADELSSDLSQNARNRVLTRIRKGELRFLVATDVASRGIDIPALSHVFLFEPPDDPNLYIHRAGRTGRAGAAGIAISLVDVLEENIIKKIASIFKIDLVKRELPTDEDVQNLVSQRVTALLEAKVRDRDKLKIERMERFIPLVKSLAESEDEIRLLAMLVDDYYQQTLHNPPDEILPPKSQKSGSQRSKRGRGRSTGKGRPRGGRSRGKK